MVILGYTDAELFDSESMEMEVLRIYHDYSQTEKASDIISNVAVEEVGVDVIVKFGDSSLESPNYNF